MKGLRSISLSHSLLTPVGTSDNPSDIVGVALGLHRWSTPRQQIPFCCRNSQPEDSIVASLQRDKYGHYHIVFRFAGKR